MKKTIILTLIMCIVLPVLLSACTPAHEHAYSAEITKQPTCKATGIKTYTCTVCKKTYTEEIPMTEHTFTEEVTVKATCEKEGVKTKTCIDCGYSEKEAIPMAEHEYEEKVTKKATCTKKGSKTLTCSVCGDTKKEEIPAKGHDFKEKITKKATCTKAGKKTLTCKTCGLKKTEKIPAKGHQWINATCTKAKKCSVCGKKDGKALGHSPNADGRCTRCGQDVGLITIKLKGKALPRTLKNDGIPTVKITEFSYKADFEKYASIGTDTLYLYFSGECVASHFTSDECEIGYKLYDSSGYVIASGIVYTESMSYGDKFRNQSETIYFDDVRLVKGATYYLELLNVS